MVIFGSQLAGVVSLFLPFVLLFLLLFYAEPILIVFLFSFQISGTWRLFSFLCTAAIVYGIFYYLWFQGFLPLLPYDIGNLPSAGLFSIPPIGILLLAYGLAVSSKRELNQLELSNQSSSEHRTQILAYDF
jgi:hypothetical protein